MVFFFFLKLLFILRFVLVWFFLLGHQHATERHPQMGVFLHNAHAEGAGSEILSSQHKYYCIQIFSPSRQDIAKCILNLNHSYHFLENMSNTRMPDCHAVRPQTS